MNTMHAPARPSAEDVARCLEAIIGYHGDIDRGRATAGIRHFADDARFQARGQEHVGRDEILGFLTRREANTGRHTVHVVANPVTSGDEDGSVVISAMILLYALDEAGAYALENVLDTTHRFTLVGGTWLIADRTSRQLHPQRA